MRILIVACITFTAILSSVILSACSRTATTTATETGTPPSLTGAQPSTTSVKPSTATVGWVTVSSTAPVLMTTEADPFRITTSTYQIKEVGELWWTFDYAFKVQNNTNHTLDINLIVQFLDSDNFEIAVEHLNDVLLQANELKTINGVMKVEAALAWDMTMVSVGFN